MQPRAIKENSDITEFRPVSIVTRPLRLGYVINREVEEADLKQVFEYNCSIWGGRFNLFVPTDGEKIREDWWRMLHQHDPDYVIYVGEIDPQLSEQVYKRLQPFWQYAWSEDWIQGFLEDRNRIGAISIIALLARYRDSHGEVSTERSLWSYPKIEASRFARLLELAFGSYSSDSNYREAFLQVLGASETVCSPETLSEYLSLVEELSERYTPFDFTGQHCGISFGGLGQRPSLIVTDGAVDDLFLYQAARVSSWPLAVYRQI